MKISLFNYSMFGYISPIVTSLPHIYIRNSGLIPCSIFCNKLDFPTANHNKYIKLHWAQFSMIGNT